MSGRRFSGESSHRDALVGTENGSVVRKWLGHPHIPRHLAPLVDAFLRDSLSPTSTSTSAASPPPRSPGPSRVRKHYSRDQVATPHNRFRSMPDAAFFLRSGVTLEELDRLGLANHRQSPGHQPQPSPSTTRSFMLMSGLEETWTCYPDGSSAGSSTACSSATESGGSPQISSSTILRTPAIAVMPGTTEVAVAPHPMRLRTPPPHAPPARRRPSGRPSACSTSWPTARTPAPPRRWASET